ncbi:MAG: hypothetical protein NTY48_02325 [Candidatus Diapherotrites archaeon]|nr:hypothetical protein [Candidatus Diapherotrites archaeon]
MRKPPLPTKGYPNPHLRNPFTALKEQNATLAEIGVHQLGHNIKQQKRYLIKRQKPKK